MKKSWLSLGVTALAALTLVGCSGGDSNPDSSIESSGTVITEVEEDTEIVFWHAMNGDQEKALEKITDDFMKEHENITVKLQNQSSYPELQQKIVATLASPKDLPTITQAYPDWILDATLDGLVQDLGPYIEDKTIGIDDYNDIVEGFRESGVIDGTTYGIPFNKSTEVIFYNKTMLDELSIDVPETLEEFRDACQKVYDEKGIAGGGFDSLNNYYVSYLENEGITFDPDFNATDKESVDAVEYYLEGIQKGGLRIAGSDKYLSGPFGAEQVAFSIGSTAGETYIKDGADGKFEVGAARYPMKKSIQQGTDVYMFSEATDIQKSAAFQYMSYLVEKDVQLYWAKETGYLPVRTSAIEEDAYQNSGTLIAPIVKEITQDLYTKPVVEGSSSAFNETTVMMEKVLSDKNSDVESVLDGFQKTLESTWQ